jgi:hypothetical protein
MSSQQPRWRRCADSPRGDQRLGSFIARACGRGGTSRLVGSFCGSVHRVELRARRSRRGTARGRGEHPAAAAIAIPFGDPDRGWLKMIRGNCSLASGSARVGRTQSAGAVPPKLTRLSLGVIYERRSKARPQSCSPRPLEVPLRDLRVRRLARCTRITRQCQTAAPSTSPSRWSSSPDCSPAGEPHSR